LSGRPLNVVGCHASGSIAEVRKLQRLRKLRDLALGRSKETLGEFGRHRERRAFMRAHSSR
ncbi:hypothetical protein E4U26_008072, partial [Claviceps purpurea]